MEQEAIKIRCQRIGCNALFSDKDNPDDSCIYHESGPVFHDGMKEWSCCKERSHDFNQFLEIPGCKKGKHSSEKPQPLKPCVAKTQSVNVKQDSTKALSKQACPRCCQGFFCSDHGSQLKPSTVERNIPVQEVASAPAYKVIDINQPQICRNKGCGKTFAEKDNHETACNYHSGPAVFHDRMRGWKCCDTHVTEFDEFLNIPPCTKGWHNAHPAS